MRVAHLASDAGAGPAAPELDAGQRGRWRCLSRVGAPLLRGVAPVGSGASFENCSFALALKKDVSERMRAPPATAIALLTVSPEARPFLVIPARGAADEAKPTPHDGTEGHHPIWSSHTLVDRSELPLIRTGLARLVRH